MKFINVLQSIKKNNLNKEFLIIYENLLIIMSYENIYLKKHKNQWSKK